MRQLAAVLIGLIVLTTAVVAGAGLAGPDPAQFVKRHDTESEGRRLMAFIRHRRI